MVCSMCCFAKWLPGTRLINVAVMFQRWPWLILFISCCFKFVVADSWPWNSLWPIYCMSIEESWIKPMVLHERVRFWSIEVLQIAWNSTDTHTHIFKWFFLFQCINNKSKLTRAEFTTWVWFQFCIVSTQYWPYMMYVVVCWIDLIPDILRSKVHSMGATHRLEGNPFS